MENVYYVRTSSLTWDDATLDLVEAAMVDWETTDASDLRADSVALYEVVATDLTSLFGIRKAYDVSPEVVGSLAGPLPANATIAAKADIGRRGRGTAGRTYWIGLSAGQISTTGDQILPLAADEILSALNVLVSTIAGLAPIEGMCIPHFVVDHVRPPTVLADIIVKYVLSDFYLDSQRDRLPNHKKRHKIHVGPTS
jgi:hypothetical protein